MEKIDKATLDEILITDGYSITLLNAAGEKISVEHVYCFTVQDGTPDFKCAGFKIKGSAEETAEDFNGLLVRLKTMGAGDGQYLLDNIDGQFSTVKELREKIDFDHISMDGLLKRYEVADRFSLTTDYGDVKIDGELADRVLKELAQNQYEMAREQFQALTQEEREQLPPFEELYEEINAKCLAYRKRHRKRIGETGGHSFFCDEQRKGKYKDFSAVWHIYSAVDFVQAAAYDLQRLKANSSALPIDRQLEGLPVLKEALISAEPTYVTHCTISGSLSTVFTFALNDRTREWLKTHKDDYDFNTAFDAGQEGYRLDDLALYCGEKILFSSCTHEHFHSDCAVNERRK